MGSSLKILTTTKRIRRKPTYFHQRSNETSPVTTILSRLSRAKKSVLQACEPTLYTSA